MATPKAADLAVDRDDLRSLVAEQAGVVWRVTDDALVPRTAWVDQGFA